MASIADYIDRPTQYAGAFQPLELAENYLVEVDIDRRVDLVDLPPRKPCPIRRSTTGQGFRHVRFLAQNVPVCRLSDYALEADASESVRSSAECFYVPGK